MRDFRDAKLMAKTLRQALADRDISLTHSETLEIVARQFGLEQWNILSAKIDAAGANPSAIGIEPPMPIFRIFSVEKAMEFYCGFLGFHLDWEHRFGENFPLYCQSRATAWRCTSANIPATPAPAPRPSSASPISGPITPNSQARTIAT